MPWDELMPRLSGTVPAGVPSVYQRADPVASKAEKRKPPWGAGDAFAPVTEA
jgi:hypothetical protein